MSQFQPPSQPTWPGQPVPPPPRKKSRLKLILAIVGGALIVLCALSSLAAYVGSTFHNTTIAATPTATTAPTQAVLRATNVPTGISTDVPTAILTTASTPTQTPSPTPSPTSSPTPSPTHASQPTPKPTQPPPPPKPTPTPCSQPCNPWGYNFSCCKLIYYPPSNFCAYFHCIPSFWGSDDPGDGYINECVDGTYSQSGGERGDCSYHGGKWRPLYSH